MRRVLALKMQFATEVNTCVLVAAEEEEEETTAEKTIKWDQRGCKLKKEQDVQVKKELPEFIRRKCKTTFPVGYFSKIDPKMDFEGLQIHQKRNDMLHAWPGHGNGMVQFGPHLIFGPW